MNIALDFDDTYTRDPMMWNWFIDRAKERGHDVRIVTFRKRSMTDPALDYLAQKIPVIFTEYIQKREYTDSMQWYVDVWIDDSPEFIVGHLHTLGVSQNET
jgi:hypothetical protein